jgi:hypothetical protein
LLNDLNLKLEARILLRLHNRSLLSTMLALATLHGLLLRILSPPNFHTVVLHTPAGELISAASDPPRPKDEIHIVVGLSGEVWKETKEAGFGMVDSEVG